MNQINRIIATISLISILITVSFADQDLNCPPGQAIRSDDDSKWICPITEEYSLQDFNVTIFNSTVAEINFVLPLFALGRAGRAQLNYTGVPMSDPELSNLIDPPLNANWSRKSHIKTEDGYFSNILVKYYLPNLKPNYKYWFKLFVHFYDTQEPFDEPLESQMQTIVMPPAPILQQQQIITTTQVPTTTTTTTTQASTTTTTSTQPPTITTTTTTTQTPTTTSVESKPIVILKPKSPPPTTTTTTSTTTTLPPTITITTTTSTTTTPPTLINNVITSTTTSAPPPPPTTTYSTSSSTTLPPTTTTTFTTISSTTSSPTPITINQITDSTTISSASQPTSTIIDNTTASTTTSQSTSTINATTSTTSPSTTSPATMENEISLAWIENPINTQIQKYAWHLLVALTIMTILFIIVLYLYIKKSTRVIAPITSQSSYDPSFTKLVSYYANNKQNHVLLIDENNQNYTNDAILAKQKNLEVDQPPQFHHPHRLNEIYNGKQHLI